MRFLVRLVQALFTAGERILVSDGDTNSPSAIDSATLDSPLSAGSATRPTPQTDRLEGLDADRFQPLTQADAFEQTKEAGWKTAYWDPVNVIPPRDLPRIKVIDRTMIGMGLISADQLAEIHEVGEEMSEHRTDYQAVWVAGQRAVAASRNEREKRKAEKKAEAEEKRQRRRQQILANRSADIVYLGRGVSRGLADRRSNVERLQAQALPILSTPKEVADAMEVSISELRWLAFHHSAAARSHYVEFSVPKRNGGLRRLSCPHRKLAAVQRWIFQEVLSPLPVHAAAHGFVRGRGIQTNAAKHVKSTIILNSDLVEFFPSIDFARVAGLFRALGYSPAVSTIFGLLCTEAPRSKVRFAGRTYYAATDRRVLPQGACSSPAISNLVSRRLDSRLDGITRRLGWRYTRYADDLTLSTNSAPDKVAYLMAKLRHIVEEEGFAINESKTRVQRPNARQTVTGLVVNDKITIDRRIVRRMRAILHRAQSEGLEAQNRDQHPNFRMWVEGMIAYIEMVNAAQGAKLRRAYRQLSR